MRKSLTKAVTCRILKLTTAVVRDVIMSVEAGGPERKSSYKFLKNKFQIKIVLNQEKAGHRRLELSKTA